MEYLYTLLLLILFILLFIIKTVARYDGKFITFNADVTLQLISIHSLRTRFYIEREI